MITVVAALLLVLTYYLLRDDRYKLLYPAYKTLPRDLTAGWRFLKVNLLLSKWEKQNQTVPKLFEKFVKKHGKRIAFYFEDTPWTYEELEIFSNQIANYFKENGFKKGDTVALILENRPEYVGIWLGLSKLGVITALINTNLTADPLIHCINISKAKAIIYGGLYENIIENILPKIECKKLYQFNEDPNKSTVLTSSINFMKEISRASKQRPSEIDSGLSKDNIVYVYTSGTTGLPKAALITHVRLMLVAAGMHYMGCFTENDIIYNPLPMYHTAGGIMGAGQALLFSTPVVLRKKFSATNFWTDCKKYNCTVAQYIGEICRYLLAVHKEGTVIDHSVKTMMGNGLRPQIWNKFTETFKIDRIIEFYGATEGNSNLINIDNKPGAVGFTPVLATNIYPVTLIRINEETGEPVRDKEGRYIKCKINEPGLLIGKINPKRAVSSFTGYADKTATEKKIFTNVFKEGDMFFNTGDVLVQDKFGYYYFRDRTGDTFRWKGENVATCEVEAVVSNNSDLKDSIVYGVEIPGTEGRAGMMSIVDPADTLNKGNLYKALKKNLPAYAVPIFLRIIKSAELTGTFKMKKKELQDEGFDINKVKDKLYYLDTKNSNYSPLTKEIYDDIINGKIRL